MTVDDFKLLSTLPEKYDYDIFTHGDGLMVIGKCFQTIIGFYIREDKLVPIRFESSFVGIMHE
jgi:hypothetical protein